MSKKYINKDASGSQNIVNLFSTTLGLLTFLLLAPLIFVALISYRKVSCPCCGGWLRETGYENQKGKSEYYCDYCGWNGII